MVWPFKKKFKADAVIEVLDSSIKFAADKWLYFTKASPFKDDIGLRDKVIMFMPPVGEGLRNNFPALREANDAILLMIIAKGIERSGTIVIRTLTLPPSGGRGRVKTFAYRAWEREALRSIANLKLTRIHPEADLVVHLELPRPDERSDISNRIKPILHILVASGLIADDRRVMRLAARWVPKDGLMIVGVGGVPTGKENAKFMRR